MKKGWIILLFLLLASHLMAQQGYPFYRVTKDDLKVPAWRYLLNKVSVSMELGYGQTYFAHTTQGFPLVRQDGNAFLRAEGREVSNWFNAVNVGDTTASYRLVDGSGSAVFNSTSPVYPLTFSLHLELSRFKAGVGGSMLFNRFRPFTAVVSDSLVLSFEPDANGALLREVFLYGGFNMYEYANYRFDIDGRLGLTRFSANAFDVSRISSNLFFNISGSASRVFSEYFRAYIRPSYTFRSFDLALGDRLIDHRANAFMVQVGFVFNFPEIPRSPMKSDHIQMKHVIRHPKSGKLVYVRGQPFWRKQNPHYGELYPVYKKYRWYNRWKWNPY